MRKKTDSSVRSERKYESATPASSVPLSVGNLQKESRISEYIAFDSHKRYTRVDRQDHSGEKDHCHWLEHAVGAVRDYLNGYRPVAAAF